MVVIALRATPKGRAAFDEGRRPSSVTMRQHRSLLAPGPTPKSTPSRPLPVMSPDPWACAVPRARQGGAMDAIEWQVSPGLTPYEEALAEMEARAAAIRAGAAREL